MKRSPIRRGKGFRSRDRQPPEAEIPSIPRELPEAGIPASPPRRGTYGPVTLTAAPKPVEHRNEDLLKMARGKRCLINIGRCDGDETVVACHSNLAEHGKSLSRKADDEYTVWGCFSCHRALDSSGSTAKVKREWFMEAHARQITEWARIAYDMSETPKSRRAASWALEMLHREWQNDTARDAVAKTT